MKIVIKNPLKTLQYMKQYRSKVDPVIETYQSAIEFVFPNIYGLVPNVIQNGRMGILSKQIIHKNQKIQEPTMANQPFISKS